MFSSIKNAIRNTGLYKAYRRSLLIRDLRGWSQQDQEMLDFYSQFISKNTLCFDVGANVGNRVKIFLKLQSTVVAVEPQVECVEILQRAFGDNSRLTIVEKALGEKEGEAEIMISNSSTISSMSLKWINAVKESGRFSEYVWDKKRLVPLTTLDALIEQYGIPDFIKIDVEGFEYQVIKGLSRRVPVLSLEFVPETIESAFNCIDHLSALGEIALNYSIGESMQFVLKTWIPPEQMKQTLAGFSKDSALFGDVYIKFLRSER